MRTEAMDGGPVADERLAALADGALSAEEAAALRARIAEDPALAERYALFVETRELLAPAAETHADAGQDRLAAAIFAADAARDDAPRPRLSVVDGGRSAAPAASPPAPARPAPRFRFAAPALAASIALVVGGALGLAVGRGDGPAATPGQDVVAAMGAPAVAAALSSALEKTPSGDDVAWKDESAKLEGRIAVISTHGLDGGVCREYEATVEGRAGAVTGLGCRGRDGRWRTEILARKPTGDDGYAPASGASVIEGALEAMGSPGPLSADEEKRRIGDGWAGGR